MIYDVAIIGGGPVGLSAVGNLAPEGKSIVMFEKNRTGGVCLNEGCMPTKALLHSANVLDTVQNANKFGIHIEGKVNFNYKEVAQRKNQLIEALYAGSSKNMKTAGIELINEKAHLYGENSDGTVQIKAGDKIYTAKNVILASGSENFVPPIPGLDETAYISSREALQLEEAPKSLTVIGGGVLGVEFGTLFAKFGTKVDLIEMADEILPSMDKEFAGMLREYYAKQGINFHLQARAKSVKDGVVTIEKEGKEINIDNEQILLAVGRRPSINKLNLASLGIKSVNGAIVVDNRMKTSHPNVYAAGDLIGGSMLAHTGLHEGTVAAQAILGNLHKLNYNAIPGVIYTNPELAAVGATEEKLKADGIEYDKIVAPLAMSGRYVLDNDFETPGMLKVLVDKKRHILGVHILGNPASELIAIGAIAIAKDMTADELKSIVFPHPTVSGIFSSAL